MTHLIIAPTEPNLVFSLNTIVNCPCSSGPTNILTGLFTKESEDAQRIFYIMVKVKLIVLTVFIEKKVGIAKIPLTVEIFKNSALSLSLFLFQIR